MRAMTARTAHFPFQNRMMIREAKFGFLIEVAAEARFRILAWIDEIALPAAGGHVKARGTMTHFAAFDFHVFAGNINSGMR